MFTELYSSLLIGAMILKYLPLAFILKPLVGLLGVFVLCAYIDMRYRKEPT